MYSVYKLPPLRELKRSYCVGGHNPRLLLIVSQYSILMCYGYKCTCLLVHPVVWQ